MMYIPLGRISFLGCCSTFIPALPTCPGDAALFHCTVTDPFKNGLTRWKLNETSCTLDHDANVDYRTVMCLPLVEEFTAMRTMPSGTCFPSTLTVMASPELNMTSIECSFAGSIAPKSDNLIVIGTLANEHNFYVMFIVTNIATCKVRQV